MPVDTVDSLVDLIQQQELLAPAQLDELTGVLTARFPEPLALAKELLQRDWLTPYQINQIFQGRGSDLLQGDYVLLERLGEGGMGQVFKARHRQHGFIAALKLIHEKRSADVEMLRRFRREIRAAVRLDHPNIVRTVDLKEIDGTIFFAMEYLQGVDLFKLTKRRGPLHPVEACGYIRQAALGLQHAHEHNLVHRDLKPGNLFLLAKDRSIKILDFGLARVDEVDGGQSATTLTAIGHVMGTPDYIAPEQARNSHAADHRADLYSLGCTLYFLLVGQVPFPKGSMTEKLLQHQVDPPTPLLQLRPDVPPAVAAIVQKLMAKDPSERYQTAAEVVQALTTGPGQETMSDIFLPDIPEGMPLDSSVASQMETTIAETYHSDVPPPPQPVARRRWPLLLAAAAAFAVLACGALLAKWLLL